MVESQVVPFATHLRVNLHTNPIGAGERTPRLSWQLKDRRAGAAQMAYRIQASLDDPSFEPYLLAWDTGRIDTNGSTHIAYDGPALKSRERAYWRVAIWNAWGKLSDWSKPAFSKQDYSKRVTRKENGSEASTMATL